MPFVTMPGITGKVFIPEGCRITAKKHPCADCFACQQCADERCAVCRCEKEGATDAPAAAELFCASRVSR